MKNKLRTRFFINPRFQTQFIIFMLTISSVSVIAIYTSTWYFFWKLRDMGTLFQIPENHPFFEFIAQQQTLMKQIMITTTAISSFMIISLGILFSHRIVGALSRFENEMNSLNSLENYPGFHFRKTDFFPELGEAFTKMIQRLTKH